MHNTHSTIHGDPIILSRSFPKTPGSLSGQTILVDKLGKYVVGTLSNDEATGKPRSEWSSGEYFPHGTPGPGTDQADALIKAVEAFKKRAAKH